MLPFDWSFPYPSQKMPLLAANAVSASQPLAAQAGVKMLHDGGNAIDAALATAIALTVVEPVMNGIGGDMFAIVWHEGQLHGINSSGRSPAAWTPEYFKGRDKMPATGWDSVSVPGQVAGWKALHDRFGQLPFALPGLAADRAPVGHPGARLPRAARFSAGLHDRRPRPEGR
jgi:gamma-glutamyltranspeptidase / glutathione hydrolase